jgi:hypothetical protein
VNHLALVAGVSDGGQGFAHLPDMKHEVDPCGVQYDFKGEVGQGCPDAVVRRSALCASLLMVAVPADRSLALAGCGNTRLSVVQGDPTVCRDVL